MERLLWIALAGAAGTLARYGLTLGVRGLLPAASPLTLLPVATATVNVLGCLLFGAVIALMRARGWVDWPHLAVFTVGFLGAFTTFSTFAFESAELLGQPAGSGAWRIGLANLVLSPLLGLGAYLAGGALVRASVAA